MIKPASNFRAVFRQQTQALKTKLEKGIIETLSYVGELCVNHARTLDTYRDQTGNLRSSIGYVIVRDGRVLKQNFGSTGKRTKKGSFGDGTRTGQELALALAEELSGQGWGLIVVAGMNYALAVESRGLDVLTSAEQLAKSQVPVLIKQLGTQLAAKVQ